MCSCVSVIIPTYNKKHLLVKAIHSALNQSYKNIEIIVSDDGSTDGTETLVKKEFGESVVYIKHKHKGQSHARNMAILKSKCPFVGFLDHDDIWNKEFLATSLQHLKKTPGAIASFTNYKRVYENGANKIVFSDRKPPREVDIKWLIGGSFIDPSVVVARKEYITKAGMFRDMFNGTEDWDLWLRMLKMGRFVYVDEVLVEKLERFSPDFPYLSTRNDVFILESFKENLTDFEYAQLKEKLSISLMKAYRRYGKALLHRGYHAHARQMFAKSLKINYKQPKTIMRYALSFAPHPLVIVFDGSLIRKLKYHIRRKFHEGP